MTFNQLRLSSVLNKFYTELSVFDGSVFENTFFITNELHSITLSTAEWFAPHGCNHAYLIKLNTFDKISQKWQSKLENYEKFQKYYKCELVMLLPVAQDDQSNFHMSGYSVISKDYESFTYFGICPVIFEIASKRFNFTAGYQPGKMAKNWLNEGMKEKVHRIVINGILKHPHVFFEILPQYKLKFHITASDVVTNLNFMMFVTPAKKYTAYEKFTLPFDLLTWVLLASTFSTAFLTIFIINYMPKLIQNIIYGHKVVTPTLNVIRIFFGISQTMLPSKNFSRSILIIFIFFCLIFKTCFQSKFFEFMTSEPRKLPPKNIEELFDRGYEVFAMDAAVDVAGKEDRFGRIPNVTLMDPLKYLNALLTQSQNASAKMALAVDEFYINYMDKLEKDYFIGKRTTDWNRLDNTLLYTSHDVFIFVGNVFYTHQFLKIIKNLIPTGIMSYLIENFYTRKWKFDKVENGPKVLSLDDLAFGFNIWLGFCAISFCGFFLERVKNLVSIRRKKSKVHPMKDQVEENNNNFCILAPSLIEKFRVKSDLKNEVVKNLVETEKCAEIESEIIVEEQSEGSKLKVQLN